MSNINSILRFVGYRIIESNFKLIDNDPNIKNFKINPQIGCKVNNGKEGFDIILTVVVEQEQDNPKPFEMFINIIGRFKLDDGYEGSNDEFLPNAAAILFPYLRCFISTLTLNANITPYNLPVINVGKLFELKGSEESEIKEN